MAATLCVQLGGGAISLRVAPAATPVPGADQWALAHALKHSADLSKSCWSTCRRGKAQRASLHSSRSRGRTSDRRTHHGCIVRLEGKQAARRAAPAAPAASAASPLAKPILGAARAPPLGVPHGIPGIRSCSRRRSTRTCSPRLPLQRCAGSSGALPLSPPDWARAASRSKPSRCRPPQPPRPRRCRGTPCRSSHRRQTLVHGRASWRACTMTTSACAPPPPRPSRCCLRMRATLRCGSCVPRQGRARERGMEAEVSRAPAAAPRRAEPARRGGHT
jgi:hypothetical protein